ncbi:hypothetical protein K9B33_21015 [Sphingobium sp. 3R8]|uniref:hypothetical protein n=1 Tax=Sphingobium sp. 3R8 TaxID=2874921 RepID=UPI001CCF8B43|nr:hypothetical protein [Sphingobium sp. 3R8]MBZ9650019.1 hypothetical protein [Sphingobium sp. 3R8]
MKTPRRKLMEKAGIVKPKDSGSEAAMKMTLIETAGRAALTATVTFAVGWMLKKMFDKSVEQAVPQPQPRIKPSSVAPTSPAAYRSPPRRLPPDQE